MLLAGRMGSGGCAAAWLPSRSCAGAASFLEFDHLQMSMLSVWTWPSWPTAGTSPAGVMQLYHRGLSARST